MSKIYSCVEKEIGNRMGGVPDAMFLDSHINVFATDHSTGCRVAAAIGRDVFLARVDVVYDAKWILAGRNKAEVRQTLNLLAEPGESLADFLGFTTEVSDLIRAATVASKQWFRGRGRSIDDSCDEIRLRIGTKVVQLPRPQTGATISPADEQIIWRFVRHWERTFDSRLPENNIKSTPRTEVLVSRGLVRTEAYIRSGPKPKRLIVAHFDYPPSVESWLFYNDDPLNKLEIMVNDARQEAFISGVMIGELAGVDVADEDLVDMFGAPVEHIHI